MLLKKPGFTVLAVITLALGIGSNTVIFSGVYALLLQALPYPNADRMVIIFQSSKQGDETGVSYSDFTDWKAQNTIFEQMAVSRRVSMNMTDGSQAERVNGSYCSQDLIPLLGGRIRQGRGFLAEEFRPASDKVVILSHGFWEHRFGQDAAIIGKKLKLEDEEFAVIGVMPPDFQYP